MATWSSETMARTDYHLLTRWELEATPQEVYELIADAASYPEWWPSVFLEARVLEPGDERGVGRLVEVRTAGFLPWTLRWRYRVTTVRPGERIAVENSGDLAGLGVWAFEPHDRHTVVRLNWRGHVERPVWRLLPTFLKPFFTASHRWAMDRGFTSVLLEVWRRRTDDREAREWLPKPPGPAFPHNLRRWWASRRSPPAPQGSGVRP